jgi:hypothetical protein
MTIEKLAFLKYKGIMGLDISQAVSLARIRFATFTNG